MCSNKKRAPRTRCARGTGCAPLGCFGASVWPGAPWAGTWPKTLIEPKPPPLCCAALSKRHLPMLCCLARRQLLLNTGQWPEHISRKLPPLPVSQLQHTPAIQSANTHKCLSRHAHRAFSPCPLIIYCTAAATHNQIHAHTPQYSPTPVWASTSPIFRPAQALGQAGVDCPAASRSCTPLRASPVSRRNGDYS